MIKITPEQKQKLESLKAWYLARLEVLRKKRLDIMRRYDQQKSKKLTEEILKNVKDN